jgi:hypothetical protein
LLRRSIDVQRRIFCVGGEKQRKTVRPDLNVRVAVRVGARDVDAWETDYRIRHDAHRSRKNLRGAKRRHRSTHSTNPAELRCARHGTQDPIVAKQRRRSDAGCFNRLVTSARRGNLSGRAAPHCRDQLEYPVALFGISLSQAYRARCPRLHIAPRVRRRSVTRCVERVVRNRWFGRAIVSGPFAESDARISPNGQSGGRF